MPPLSLSLHGRKGRAYLQQGSLKALFSAAIDGEVTALNNKTAATNETTALIKNMAHPSQVLIRIQGCRYF
jgi:hypothetical protein